MRVRYFGHIVIQLNWELSALSFRRGQLPAAKFYKVFNLVHKYLIRIGWYRSRSKVRNQRRNLGNNLGMCESSVKQKLNDQRLFLLITIKIFLSILIILLACLSSRMFKIGRLQKDSSCDYLCPFLQYPAICFWESLSCFHGNSEPEDLQAR